MKNFKIFTIVFTLLLSGCAVSGRVWNQKIDRDEVARDIKINKDGDKVIVVGKKYNYLVSDDKKIIKKLFFWDGKSNLQIFVDSIRARGEEASVRIYFITDVKIKTEDLSDAQIKFLKSVDAKINSNTDALVIPSLDLKGSRALSSAKINFEYSDFSSTGFVSNEQKTAIFEDPTPIQIAGKVLVTPFTVAADILLIPITVPYFIYHQVRESQTDHFCEGSFCGYDKIKTSTTSKSKK